MTDAFKCAAQAASPAIRLKGQSEMFGEITPHPHRITIQCAQILVCKTAPRLSFYSVQNPTNPVRSLGFHFHWLAAQTGAVSGKKRFFDGGKKFRVFGHRL